MYLIRLTYLFVLLVFRVDILAFGARPYMRCPPLQQHSKGLSADSPGQLLVEDPSWRPPKFAVSSFSLDSSFAQSVHGVRWYDFSIVVKPLLDHGNYSSSALSFPLTPAFLGQKIQTTRVSLLCSITLSILRGCMLP